jgi:hypothetical protein
LSVNWNKGLFSTIDGQANHTDISVSVSDGFRLFRHADHFRIYWGYAVTVNQSYTKVDNKDDIYYSWSSNNSLDLYQSYSYNWKRQTVSLDICIPVIGFSSRPLEDEPYPSAINEALFNSYNQNFFTSLHNSRSISMSASFKKILNEKWELLSEVNYKISNQESGISFYRRSHGIRAGISLKIR